MARYLADTNLLLRLADASPQNATAARALARLWQEGHEVFITPQNLVEFWAVATRPTEANGLGWDLEKTRREAGELRQRFPPLPESPGIFEAWLRLVESLPVTGKRVHDARLVAAMQVHGLDRLLTFNTADFVLFTGLTVIDPATLAH